MGYDPLDICANTLAVNGSPIGSVNGHLDAILSQSSTFSGPLKNPQGTTIYAGRIASILLVGVRQNRPVFIQVSVPKFIEAYSQGGVFLGSPQICHTLSYARVQSLNPAFSPGTEVPYYGATISPWNSNGNLNWWTDIDKQYCNNDKVLLFQLLQRSIHRINEAQARYGYQFPVTAANGGASEALNWIRASPNGLQTDTDACFFRWMYLTEFDLFAHAGMIALGKLTPDFVRQPIFTSMLQSMLNPGDDPTLSTFQNSRVEFKHSTLLQKGDHMLSGKYIYSKDFRYKLFLHCNGFCAVYALPISQPSLADAHFVLNANTGKIGPGSYPIARLSLQADANVVIYVGFTPVWSTGGVDNPIVGIGARKPYYALLDGLCLIGR